MDGTEVWTRTSIYGKPGACRSQKGGPSCDRQDAGLPLIEGSFSMKRQAFAAAAREPVGLYFGTTSGEIWMSKDEGERWGLIASHLPHIYSITTAMVS